MRQSTAVATALVLAWIGVRLLELNQGARESMAGLFLIVLAIWIGLAALKRGIIR